jgi:hypothetical protein
VADIRKHVTCAKVELPTSLQGVVRVLNNYCRLLDVLFGPDCQHLTHIISIQDGLETHEVELESHLTGVLILHLMWRVHHDARQFFLACERWEDGEQLPHPHWAIKSDSWSMIVQSRSRSRVRRQCSLAPR